MSPFINLVSSSGGKDSTATLCLALDRRPRETVRAVAADTGHEHPLTYEYWDYLESRLGIEIIRVMADLSPRFERKRKFILEKWPEAGVPVDRCERAAALMVPSGNPYLDLCMLKGRFPSRMAQFCTDELKVIPITRLTCGLLDEGKTVISWQGIRRDESQNRAGRKMFEPDPLWPGLFVYRPIARATVDEVFEIHRRFGVDPNPLYKLGMNRVGCMPCINASKGEVAEIARRFPEVIERIAEWEHLVADVSRRGAASFFPAPDDGRGELRGRDIRTYVEWAKTSRGGRQYSLDALIEPPMCASAYGLCE